MKVSFLKLYNGCYDSWGFKSTAEDLPSMQEALGSSPGIIKEAMKMATPTGLCAPNTLWNGGVIL